ncbi:MAG: ADP-glyceromanno-heptose 6-epimerase [Chitinivibrionales bacterium]|nr:ADP-glyceromanno-heptose 6-epimerase [Chitinivibrionales bacterium]
MIVVTGGAGFIGSALIWKLNARGISDILVVDDLNTSEKWKNLPPLRFAEYLDRLDFIAKLESNVFGSAIDAILHMGACSSTTESNAAYLMENNYRYTLRIAQWWEKHPKTRLIYASSAATYGDGNQGYADNEAGLQDLRPLNMYGYSKQLFDLRAQRSGWLDGIAGLKFFNVFGPNEYHKGDMRSLICKAYSRVRSEGKIRLFKSYNAAFKDGEQVRDFIYVKDAVEMALYFLDNPGVNGIYNIGTGRSRSWNDVAAALFAAAGVSGKVEYIPMPPGLQEKYQYKTQADCAKLVSRGCVHKCLSLEEAVGDYARNYLAHNAYLENA